MAIERIDKKKCIGCGVCALSCPMDVIRMDPEELCALVRYAQECIVCGVCVADCPSGAIEMTPGKHSMWFSSGY